MRNTFAARHVGSDSSKESSHQAEEVGYQQGRVFPMAYSNFTPHMLEEQLGITATDADNPFGEVPPLPASDFFRTLLKRRLLIVSGFGTEKARSEMISDLLLVESREQSARALRIP